MDLGLRGEALSSASTSISFNATTADGESSNTASDGLRLSFGAFLFLYAQHCGLMVPRAGLEGIWVPNVLGMWREVLSCHAYLCKEILENTY